MIFEVGTPKQISATATVRIGIGKMVGVFCSSSTSGTLTLYDNTSAAGTLIVAAFNLTAGQYYQIPAAFVNGVHAVISGTAEITIFVG